ncbi:MAG: M15 family metallopeptidase [Akkermansiaceae bacterium]
MKYSHETYCLQIGLKTLGFDPGAADGLRGRKTNDALAASSAARFGSKSEASKADGSRPPRPKPTTSDKTRLFGKAGSPSMAYFEPPFPMVFSWNGKKVGKIGCHKLIAAPLEAALKEFAAKGETWIKKHGLHLYAGCFNYRRSRGGRSLSDHAWAIAIDLNPDANGNHQTWKPGTKGSNGTYQMPKTAVMIFKRHGFQVGFRRSDGGRRDMMHIAYVNRP